MLKNITYTELKNRFENRNYILLSQENEIINCTTKIRYICKKHIDKGELLIDYIHFNSNRGCYYCGREIVEAARRKPFDIENDKILCESKNFTYIKSDYFNGKRCIFFICNNHKELGEQTMQIPNMKRTTCNGCQYCSSKNIPDWYFKQKTKEKYPNIDVISEYTGMNKSIDCKCNIHNEYFSHIAKEVFYKGIGCKKCTYERKSNAYKLSENVVTELIKKSNQNLELVNYDEYKGCESHINIRCIKCNYIWNTTTLSSIRANNVCCPNCDNIKYKGEKMITKYLSDNNYNYKPQYRIDECGDKRSFPFDNSILDSNNNLLGLIEYYGEQHYYPVDYFGGKEKFDKLKNHDAIKQQYCKNNNIPLLIISYKDYNNIETILNEFISKLK